MLVACLAPLSLFALLLLRSGICQADVETLCTHIFTDATGHTRCANGWKSIPQKFRYTARPLSASTGVDGQGIEEGSQAATSQRDSLGTFYRYKGKKGREAYTNMWDTVPPEARSKAKAVDLSKISLNTELGNEIDQKLTEEYEKLAESDYCQEARLKSRVGWLEKTWEEYKPLVIIAAILLIFIFITPFMLRKLNTPDWARTLTMAIKTLVLIGIVVFVMVRTQKNYKTFRSASAHPCDQDTWTTLSKGPNPVMGHMKLLKSLQQQIDTVNQERAITDQRGLVK